MIKFASILDAIRVHDHCFAGAHPSVIARLSLAGRRGGCRQSVTSSVILPVETRELPRRNQPTRTLGGPQQLRQDRPTAALQSATHGCISWHSTILEVTSPDQGRLKSRIDYGVVYFVDTPLCVLDQSCVSVWWGPASAVERFQQKKKVLSDAGGRVSNGIYGPRYDKDVCHARPMATTPYCHRQVPRAGGRQNNAGDVHTKFAR